MSDWLSPNPPDIADTLSARRLKNDTKRKSKKVNRRVSERE